MIRTYKRNTAAFKHVKIYLVLSCCNRFLALQRLRGWEDVDDEMKEMRLEAQSERAEGQLSVFKLLSLRSLRWQLLSIVIINMGQQLSGVNAVSTTHWPQITQ